VLLDAKKATRKHERDSYIETDGGGEVRPKMRQEGIGAASDQRACMRRSEHAAACRANLPDPVLPQRLGYPICGIVRLARDNSPDTASGLVNIPSIPGNDVHV
jgi:hypothetical protein